MSNGLSFRKIDIEDSELTLNWRSNPRVTKFMTTDISNSLDEQIIWISNVNNNPNNFFWIIELNEIPIGVIYLNDINWEKKSGYWGYYIGNEDYLGLGGFIPPYFYNFIFNSMNFNTLYAEIFEENISVIKMHLKYGFDNEKGKNRKIKKNNTIFNLVTMKLNKENWNSNKFKNFISNLKI